MSLWIEYKVMQPSGETGLFEFIINQFPRLINQNDLALTRSELLETCEYKRDDIHQFKRLAEKAIDGLTHAHHPKHTPTEQYLND
jgi:hypothetical protein